MFCIYMFRICFIRIWLRFAVRLVSLSSVWLSGFPYGYRDFRMAIGMSPTLLRSM